MKSTVTESMFCQAFQDMDRSENFSLYGLRALFDYLEEMEGNGDEMELDVIAICCDFDEWESIAEYRKAQGLEREEDEEENKDEIGVEFPEETVCCGYDGTRFITYAH